MADLRPFARGIPLSLVIVRYFAYVIVAIGLVCAASFAAISIAISAGAVYPASYGAERVDETAEALRSMEKFDPDAVPTAYRFVRIDGAGTLLDSDLSGEGLESASRAARDYLADAEGASDARAAEVTGRNGTTYAAFGLPDNTVCVLASEFLPQFTSRALRDALPNPQNLMLAVACVGSVAAILLISRRASRVIARTMAPLTDAADRIAHEDLAFTVGSSNVRQVNDVLEAMERMRSSLEESLEARWRSEQAQRDQVAALAHDLKTPLTVVRANADYVAEETRDAAVSNGAPDAGGLEDVAAAARDIAAAAGRLDNYVRLLIEVSQGEAKAAAKGSVPLEAFAAELEQEAGALARTADVGLGVERDPALAGACIEADRESLGRAVMNVVANAFCYARGEVELSFGLDEAHGTFVVGVDDDGPGFSPEELERACERFFRGDASRATVASETHYGIGLSTATEAVRSCGGALELSNRVGEAGRILGAHVSIRIPLSEGGDVSGATL